MAKGRKAEKALTEEEWLEQVLVPEEEQPYLIPENWCWVRLGKLYQINPKNVKFDDLDAAFIPMEKIAAGMISDFEYVIQPWKKAKKGHTQFVDGDVAFAKISPCFENRKSMILKGLPNGIGGGTTELIVLRNAFVLPQFTFWLISTESFIQGGKRTYSGTVGQQRISMNYVRNYPVPLPPIFEQQRIVNHIENLFAKLDEVQEKAKAVVDGFEIRKSALLHRAFNGKLTELWRKQQGIGLDSWKTEFLSECCSISSGGTPSRSHPEYYNGNIPWVKTGEINWNYIYDAEEKISEKAIEESSAKLYNAGAVLVAMYGMGVTRGRAAILKTNAATNQAVCVLQAKDYLINLFLFYFFMCNYWDIREQAIGGNQLNLSGTIISKFQIRIPTVLEQTEIIRILDGLLEKEQQIKDAAESALNQIDTVKKSILAHAFHGKLGTNDTTEESALELTKNGVHKHA